MSDSNSQQQQQQQPGLIGGHVQYVKGAAEVRLSISIPLNPSFLPSLIPVLPSTQCTEQQR